MIDLKDAKRLRKQAEELHYRLVTRAMTDTRAAKLVRSARKRYERRKATEKELLKPAPRVVIPVMQHG